MSLLLIYNLSTEVVYANLRLVMNSGLNRLYSIEASSWIKSFFEDMAHQSPALVMVAGAIQCCFDDGHQGMSVKSMEYIDLALQTFRQELAARYEVMHFATICAGLLVCSLCVRLGLISSHDSSNTNVRL